MPGDNLDDVPKPDDVEDLILPLQNIRSGSR
jgi:hypothetical protein